ncbi:cysteine hydrolase family protein [Cupriavidus sp. 2TAF22]|uniref:cysteine hydrolase family protein n=1 Tax=unclassified Cupriavidus TaxID=2640874 RepID=UPI003F93DA2D
MSSALLVIDVQEGLFGPAPQPASADAVIGNINALIARARGKDVPVIFIQHETREDELRFDTPGWQLVAALDARAHDHFIRKTTPDSFLRTELGALLSTLAVSHVVLCGYATEFCVDTTARRAAALGLDVTLAADAHTTHDKPHASAEMIRVHHNATLPSISSFGSKIAAHAAAQVDLRA